MAVIFLSFINFIYSVPLISNLIALCFAVLYSAYILIDTQIILGRGKTKLNLDNYVLGAILLYIDIIGLFLEILKLIGNRRSDWKYTLFFIYIISQSFYALNRNLGLRWMNVDILYFSNFEFRLNETKNNKNDVT